MPQRNRRLLVRSFLEAGCRSIRKRNYRLPPLGQLIPNLYKSVIGRTFDRQKAVYANHLANQF